MKAKIEYMHGAGILQDDQPYTPRSAASSSSAGAAAVPAPKTPPLPAAPKTPPDLGAEARVKSKLILMGVDYGTFLQQSNPSSLGWIAVKYGAKNTIINSH